MNVIKFIVTVFILVFSGQSLALFMPAGERIETDTSVVSNDVGC